MNKLYLIIITHALNMQVDTVKAHLGYQDMIPSKTIDLFSAQYISSGVCIGKYGDNILIVDPKNILEFYSKEISVYENNMRQLFPNSEILALNLYSVVDMYGYSIIDHGRRLRTKWATDDETFIDMGKIINEEKDAVANKDLGAAVPMRLLTKYLGNESDLNKVVLTEFKEKE